MAERRVSNGHGVVIVVNEPDPEEPAEPAEPEKPAPAPRRSSKAK
jgi:hypothetical protein